MTLASTVTPHGDFVHGFEEANDSHGLTFDARSSIFGTATEIHVKSFAYVVDIANGNGIKRLSPK